MLVTGWHGWFFAAPELMKAVVVDSLQAQFEHDLQSKAGNSREEEAVMRPGQFLHLLTWSDHFPGGEDRRRNGDLEMCSIDRIE